MTHSRLLTSAPAVALFALALAVRLHQQHDALLYPDGYQYLLMARGIGEHLQPTTVLGPGGDLFAPSPDAAAKPLFPLVVAAVYALGVSLLDAARLITAVAGACVVTAVALLVSRLSGSRIAGVAAALLVFGMQAMSSLPVLRAIGLTVALGVGFHFCLSILMARHSGRSERTE